jgi:hypothetical protein
MAPTAFRHPLVVAGVVATLGAGIAAPAATAASAPPAPQASTQLLGGLLGGLLDTATAPILSIITPLVEGNGGVLPAVLPAGTVEKLTDAITGAVDGVVPADVTKLLTALTPAQLTQLISDPAAVAPLLTGILPTLTSLASGSTLPAAAVTSALSQVTALLGGGIPTSAEALAVLTNVVDQVAKLLGYPSVASLPAVGPLIAALATVGKALPDGPSKTAVVGAVSTAGTSLGLSPAQIAQALELLGLGRAVAKPASTTPAPAATTPAKSASVARARIASASISKNRRKVTYRVTCPTSSVAGCRVTPKIKVGGKTVRTKAATVAAGRTKTFRATVPASVAKKVRKAGGKMVVTLKTAGSTAGAVTKTVRVRRAS